MKIEFLGHACIYLEGSKNVLIDPFLNGNPLASKKPEDFENIDYILVTHDHMDHLGDTKSIAKRTGAVVVCIHEIAEDLSKSGIKSEGMNIGGSINLDDLTVHMVNAVHSGGSTGMIFELDGKTFYHTGDTALFSDMKIYGEFFDVDVMFLPIGDRYTMGPKSASRAVEFVKPKKVIPIHYDTFPILTGKPNEFKSYVEDKAEVIVLKPGENIEI